MDGLARVLSAQTRNIAVVKNATVALSQVLSAFEFRHGDEMVTTRNDYVSNQLAYLSLVRRYRIETRRAANLRFGGVDPDSIRQLLRDPRLRFLAVT